VLKTNVDLERAKLIQSTLTAPQADSFEGEECETGSSGDKSPSGKDEP
jgi:hypothetical protein